MTTDWQRYIVKTPDVLKGKARLDGTRIPVTMILQFLKEEMTYEEIIDEFSDLTPAHIEACIAYQKALKSSN